MSWLLDRACPTPPFAPPLHPNAPARLAQIGDIRNALNTLRSSIAQIKTLHAQSLNSTSGPPPELGALVEETREMSQDLKQRIKGVNSSTGGDKGKKQQVKGVKEQFVGLLGEYQVRHPSSLDRVETNLNAIFCGQRSEHREGAPLQGEAAC